MTIWTPDTDDCQIEISDDPATRGQIVGFIRASKVHATPADVLAENQRKNRICADVEAAGVKRESFVWSISPTDRAVVITVVDGSLTGTQKARLEDDLEAKSGTGTVRVV